MRCSQRRRLPPALGLLVLGVFAVQPPDDTVVGAASRDSGVVALVLIALVAGALVDMMVMALASWLLILATRQRRAPPATSDLRRDLRILAATATYSAILLT